MTRRRPSKKPPEGRPAPRPHAPPSAAGDIEWHFLEARRLLEAGAYKAAMEQAGFGTRLDLARPEGYLLLGELGLLTGDLGEARKSFAAAAARSRAAVLCAALAGLAQVAWVAGELCEARTLHEEILATDPADPLNVRPALVELLLLLGDPEAAREELLACEDTSPDVHLLSAITSWLLGDLEGAVSSARLAYLWNLYVPAALDGARPPDVGLVHGLEEAGPEHAAALAERLEPILRPLPDSGAFLRAVAGTKAAKEDAARLVQLARRLQQEPAASARRELQKGLDELRDPARIAATSEAVLAEVRRAHPGGPPSRGSFDV